MTFQKGQAWAGNALGPPAGERLFRTQLKKASLEIDPLQQKRKLRVIAEKTVSLAMKGEPWAVQMVADRLDGKAVSEVQMTVEMHRDIKQLSDDELLALIAKAQNVVEGEATDVTPRVSSSSESNPVVTPTPEPKR